MKILITGTNGFIGSHIANSLKIQHQITGIGTKDQSLVEGIEYFKVDISNDDDINHFLAQENQFDAIVHGSAYISKDNFDRKLIDVNCYGSLNILKIIQQHHPKVVIHTSGITVIGEPHVLPIKENHPLKPISLYHSTKAFTEFIMHRCPPETMYINLRIPSPIGAGMNPKTILPIFLKNAIDHKTINLYGKGSRKQNYLDIQDIVNCVRLILNKPDAESGNYNIGAKTSISNLDLAKLCIECVDSTSKIEFIDKPDPQDHLDWTIDTSKAKQTFGFEPMISIKESISNIIQSL